MTEEDTLKGGFWSGDDLQEQTSRDLNEFYGDAAAVKKMSRFIMTYTYHAAQKTKLDKTVKDNQTEAYWNDQDKEADNDFRGFADELTVSDMAWTTWHYVNSYEDWCRKLAQKAAVEDDENMDSILDDLVPVEGRGKYKAKTKWTSDGKRRRQPRPGSDGMRFYETLENWFRQFKLHRNFVLIRKEVNRLGKLYHILPTYSDENEPRSDGGGNEGGELGTAEEGVSEAPIIQAFLED
jgi:hypothetical protein